MPLERALRHPAGLALLLASLALALALAALPALRPWSSAAAWVLIWGAVGYGAIIVALRWARAHPEAAEVRQLRAIRRAMARRLAERQWGEGLGVPSELASVLGDRLQRLDDILPALRQLTDRQRALTRQFSLYEGGRLPRPESAALERLQAIHDRQRKAVAEAVQRLASADATLVALLQEGDHQRIGARATAWAQDLPTLHETLTAALLGADEVPALAALPEYQTVPAEVLAVAVGRDGEVAHSSPAWGRLVEEALRRLNRVELANCALVARLPCTLATVQARWPDPASGGPGTPLGQGRALRELLAAAIERLGPADRTARAQTAQALQYHILHDEYVLERSNVSIMTRYSISESTFHRLRREAISLLARELQRQEELCAGRGFNATAGLEQGMETKPGQLG